MSYHDWPHRRSTTALLRAAIILLTVLIASPQTPAQPTGQSRAPARPGEEPSQVDRAHAARLTEYLSNRFPQRITEVRLDAGTITITGQLSQPSADLQLAEVPMWEDITALQKPLTLLPIVADAHGRFVKKTERMADASRDRLLSAWAIVRRNGERYELLSAQHYIDRQTPRADLPPAKLTSRKGICGCPFDSADMQELGVGSVTLNIVLNDLIGSQSGKGQSDYSYAGRTWHTRDAAVARLDKNLKIAADHGWRVSAIILIAPVRKAPPDAWVREAAHPEADPIAPFVMPNFTTRTGVEAYAAAMNFLAERYSRADGPFGRIHHWIMHNEVSSGYCWTTAGDKTATTYLDLYQKSLRLAYLIAGQYDRHARPVVSLDHCWGKNLDKRGYAGRELLDRLVDFSHAEGDFPWAIGLHPYSHDLFNARVWEDSEISYQFSTPLITYKNLEVIDAWASQPRVAYLGKTPREVQLTEQGVNTRDYTEKGLIDQAASLAYVWKKIEPLKTISVFQYHRWADAREEGGLRLGLRKFSNEPGDALGKKPSWAVFQAIETDRWDEATRFALPVIGIRDWSEVRYTGKILPR